MENASHRYSSAEIKAKIRRQTEKYGWEFIFLAANIDAVATAEHIGIRRERADTLMKREYMEAMCERTGEQWQL